LLGLTLALATLFYAAPRLPLYSGDALGSVFGLVWLCFALVVAGSHLYHVIGVDRETEQHLQQLRRIRLKQKEAWLLARTRRARS